MLGSPSLLQCRVLLSVLVGRGLCLEVRRDHSLVVIHTGLGYCSLQTNSLSEAPVLGQSVECRDPAAGLQHGRPWAAAHVEASPPAHSLFAMGKAQLVAEAQPLSMRRVYIQS